MDFDSESIEAFVKDDSDEVEALRRELRDSRQVETEPTALEPAIDGPAADPGVDPSPEILSIPADHPQRGVESASVPRVGPPNLPEKEYIQKEVVIDKNGMPRHAGSDCQEGEFVKRFRITAESSLFLFCKGVLNRHFLTKELHRPVCRFLQKVPPYRKLVLMPREHAKTAIVSGGLPLHIIIQSAERNIYFPGLEGSECRILLCGETESMAKKNLRVLEQVHTGNKMFRALWPERVWENPRQAREWSSTALIFPRENEWPDQTIRAVGVGGAITGARPNVLIKDDLISFKAANSELVMEEAIEWHKTSRALLDTYALETGLRSLEFIIGTRWAVHDLYSYIITKDPSVELIDKAFHQIIQDDKILWPEKHTKETINDLRMEYGAMFFLLYMNSAADPELVDFDLELVREFVLKGGEVQFKLDDRDQWLEKKMGKKDEPEKVELKRGARLTPSLMRELVARKQFFRARYG